MVGHARGVVLHAPPLESLPYSFILCYYIFMKKIIKSDLPAYLLGSTFFGTGGGLPYATHLKICTQAFQYASSIQIKQTAEFSPTDFLATIYGVGDPSQPIRNIKQLLQQALKEYEGYTKIKIKGLIAGEIGAEGLVFQASTILGIPAVDSDLVGGRAAPEIDMDCFTVHKKLLTPLLGVSANGKSMLLTGQFSAKEIETALRAFFYQQGGMGILIGYPMQAKSYQHVGMQGTLTKTEQAGRLLVQGKTQELLQAVEGKLVDSVKLKKVGAKSDEGFLRGWVEFAGYQLWVKNENIALWKGKKLIAQAPDLIILLDAQGKPIHNASLKRQVGKVVQIVHIPAQEYWKKSLAKALWKTALK